MDTSSFVEVMALIGSDGTAVYDDGKQTVIATHVNGMVESVIVNGVESLMSPLEMKSIGIDLTNGWSVKF